MDILRRSPITIFIVACWIITFFVSYATPEGTVEKILAFYPDFPKYITGIFTYNLASFSIINMLLSGLMFIMFGSILERTWDKKWYLIFLLAVSFGTLILFQIYSLVAYKEIAPLISDGWFLTTAAMVAWCAINPERDVSLWFVLPVKAKWIIPLAFAIQIFVHQPLVEGISLTGGLIVAYFYTRAMQVIPYGHHGRRIERSKSPNVIKLENSVSERERKRRIKKLTKTFKIDDE